MFGFYRTILAVFVVFQHLAMVPFIGSAAVMGFFILSGYLMTYVMQRSYGYDMRGVGRFCTNRFLRLFPSYWASLIILSGIILWVGAKAAQTYRNPLGIPDDLGGWLANLTMIYPALMPNEFMPRIAPATWALTIELCFYMLIALGASRNRVITWIWFAGGAGWHLYALVAGLDYAWQYSFIWAGALPFAMGALIYHYADELAAKLPKPLTLLVLSSIAALGSIAMVVGGRALDSNAVFEIGFYGNLVSQATIVVALSRLDIPRLRKLDALVGDWSYHIYILHWGTGLLWAVGILGMATPGRNVMSLVVVALATVTAILISLVLGRVVDGPIKALRARLRGSGSSVVREEPR